MIDLRAPWLGAALLTAAFLLCAPDAALAQAARHPFAVGANEGQGAATGLVGLILAWQSKFQLLLQNAVHSVKSDGSALWMLGAASFAYGVFHAAGPGHGKAVLASYLIAIETALRRGMALAALAALLQGAVAIGLVGAAALVLNATAKHMSDAAAAIETASYAIVALLGARLVWTKGRALFAASRNTRKESGYACEAVGDPAHVHGPACGHLHALDAAALGARAFSWPDALATAAAAGLRPCSGAILVLVFSASQGLFPVGVLATLLMSAGTAITTGALASTAVFAKNTAIKFARPDSPRAAQVLRGAEFLAALLVLALGLALLVGTGAATSGP